MFTLTFVVTIRNNIILKWVTEFLYKQVCFKYGGVRV